MYFSITSNHRSPVDIDCSFSLPSSALCWDFFEPLLLSAVLATTSLHTSSDPFWCTAINNSIGTRHHHDLSQYDLLQLHYLWTSQQFTLIYNTDTSSSAAALERNHVILRRSSFRSRPKSTRQNLSSLRNRSHIIQYTTSIIGGRLTVKLEWDPIPPQTIAEEK